MEEIKQELKFEVLRGPLVDKFITANQAFHADGIIKVWPPSSAILAEFRHHAEKIRKFTVKEDDVWIVRTRSAVSGTARTAVQELNKCTKQILLKEDKRFYCVTRRIVTASTRKPPPVQIYYTR